MSKKDTPDRVITLVPAEEEQEPKNDKKNRRTSHDRSVEDILESLDEIGGNVTMTINRVLEGGGTRYIETHPADRMSYSELCDYLRKRLGGGLFRLYFHQTGRKGMLENKLLDVEPYFDNETGKLVGGGGDSSLVRDLIAQNNRIMDKLAQRGDSKTDLRETIDLMVQLSKATPAGIAAAAAAPVAQKPLLEQLNELFGTIAALQAGGSKMMGLFGGGGEPTHWVERLADKHSHLLEPVIARVFLGDHQPRTAPARRPADAHQPQQRQPQQQPAAGNRPGQPTQQERETIGSILRELTEFAAQDVDPGPVADELISKPELQGFVSAFKNMTQAQAFKMLSRMWPATLDYPGWFLELIEVLQEKLQPPSAGGDTSPQADADGEKNADAQPPAV